VYARRRRVWERFEAMLPLALDRPVHDANSPDERAAREARRLLAEYGLDPTHHDPAQSSS
jgi:hypothetical protein